MSRLPSLSRLVAWLLSPYVLALVVTLPVIMVLPDLFPAYRLELTDHWLIEKPNAFIRYADIDGDGNSEELLLFHNTVGRPTVKITDQQKNVVGHWYFNGILPPRHPFFFTSAIDHSAKEKAFVCIQRNDSLLLQGVEFGRPDTFFIRDRFITKLYGLDGKYDYGLYDRLFFDMNGDGIEEFMFTVMAGYNLKPRGIFLYDVRNDRLLHHSPGGANFRIADVGNLLQGREPVILCTGLATNNYPPRADVVFHDSLAWLFAFDSSLKPVFPPIGFTGYTSNIHPVLFNSNNGPVIVAVLNNRGNPPVQGRLIMLDAGGRIVRQKFIPVSATTKNVGIAVVGKDRDHLYIGSGSGLYRLDGMLDTMEVIKGGNAELLSAVLMDCNDDGSMERVSSAPDKGWITVSGEDFSHPVKAEIPGRYNTIYNISLKKSRNRPPEIAAQFSDHFFLFRYEKNPLHILKFPFYGGIYLVLLGFILLIQLLQRIRIRKRNQVERQLLTMQMNLISNQLDPHFTFNAINAISAAILTERPAEANRNLLSLARLMRSFVTESGSPVRTLAAELEFLKNYLELMKGRIDPSFEYEINVAPGVNAEWLVPRMVTQIYAENAINHGLRPRGGGGRLLIRVTPLNGSFSITIEDNGIGRKAASLKQSQGTGKGTQLMEMIYELFNRNSKTKVTCRVTDIMGDPGECAGTRVEITVPNDLKA